MKHLQQATVCAAATLAAAALATLTPPALAQQRTVTPAQQATAEQVAQSGVPLSELAPDAPDRHTVQRGDTLWGIAGLFLKSPWRWPELWGMNLAEIRNPHLIYPGQELRLLRKDGRALLVTGAAATGTAGEPADTPTVRVSPRTRTEVLGGGPLPTLQPNRIEPFLAEPLVVDEASFNQAPRIVATQELRVLLTRGDRAYARGPAEAPLLDTGARSTDLRIFRNAVPLKDPQTGEVLGHEAQYVGRARLARGETPARPGSDGAAGSEASPATIDIVGAREEIRVGDRLLPEPPRQFTSYAPRAPGQPVDARVVSVYGSAVRYAAQNQVVVINRGTRDGLENGHVLALLKAGERVVDKTDEARPTLRLPDERNGLVMVFRPFDRVSYALVLEITDGVKVGDRLVNPR